MVIDSRRDDEPQIEVWREFTRSQGDLMARRYWENNTFRFALQMSGTWAVLASFFLDLKLMLDPDWGVFPSLSVLIILFFALLPATLAAGWMVDFQLSLRTPRDQDRPDWLRLLRFLAACVVPLSPFVMPQIWREVLRRNPSWAAPRSRLPFHLEPRSTSETLPLRPFLKRLYESLLLQFLTLTSTLWGLSGIGVLLQADGKTAYRATLTASVLAHVIAFLCSGAMLESVIQNTERSRWSNAARLLRFLLLLPFPLSLLAFLPLLSTLTPSRLLVESAYANLHQARRLPLWRTLERHLRRDPKRLSWPGYLQLLNDKEFRGESGKVFAERGALFRLKTLFLIPEAGLLSWFAARHLRLLGTQDRTVVPFLEMALYLGLAATFVQVIPPIARALRKERVAETLSPYLVGGFLLLPAASFLIGWVGGLLIAGNRDKEFWFLLGPIVGIGALLFLVYGMFRFQDQRFDLGVLLGSGLLLPLLSLLLIVLTIRSEHSWLGLSIAGAAPCVSIVVGIFLGGALLHPFSWAQLREPTISRRTRLALTALALTAILPLGGLAIPFWIWSRQRLWLWYQRELVAEDE